MSSTHFDCAIALCECSVNLVPAKLHSMAWIGRCMN